MGLGLHVFLSIFNFVLLFTGPGALLLIITGPLWLLVWNCYVIVNPNEAVVTQFFGKYVSTLKVEGFRFFINPLYSKSKISFKINNFESSKLKVNDVNANPIDIAAVVVWRVYDAAEAMFEVENYGHYVQIQSEAALREMATKYPYDAIEEGHRRHHTIQSPRRNRKAIATIGRGSTGKSWYPSTRSKNFLPSIFN